MAQKQEKVKEKHQTSPYKKHKKYMSPFKKGANFSTFKSDTEN